MKDGRIRTLPRILHILEPNRNLISICKICDAGIHTVFEKETYKMVRGTMVLIRGVHSGTLYKLL
jgi:hypothetical protein